jgi:hypothetical protein
MREPVTTTSSMASFCAKVGGARKMADVPVSATSPRRRLYIAFLFICFSPFVKVWLRLKGEPTDSIVVTENYATPVCGLVSVSPKLTGFCARSPRREWIRGLVGPRKAATDPEQKLVNPGIDDLSR